MAVIVKCNPALVDSDNMVLVDEKPFQGCRPVKGERAFIWTSHTSGGDHLEMRGLVVEVTESDKRFRLKIVVSDQKPIKTLTYSDLRPFGNQGTEVEVPRKQDEDVHRTLARKLVTHAHNKIAELDPKEIAFLDGHFEARTGIPPTDRPGLLAAMSLFDTTLRDAPEWVNWQENKAHKYAIHHNMQLYPVKQIISMATGRPVADFSGGQGTGQANTYVTARGFTIEPLRPRNPPWARDELILALDLYLKHRAHPPAKGSPEIAELSATLGRLADKLGLAGDETYRNQNGVYMKLMNFRSLDPDYTTEGKVGLRSSGHGDRDVWDEFAADPARCAATAAAILAGLDAPDVDATSAADDAGDDAVEAEEGRRLTRLHRHRERNRDLVAKKKARVLAKEGLLRCECCGFDFQARYGERGEGFIECHHTRPVTDMTIGEKTKLSDLALLCANCHRMIHIRRPWLSLEDLQAIILRWPRKTGQAA